jgi:hypothetical protein
MLPNFLIAGQVAAGTGSLNAYLKQHPDIYMPEQMSPEPGYFAKKCEYTKPLSWYEETYFSKWDGETAAGERSSLYLSSPGAAQRIHEALPGVKLIFTLRNPIERAWGNYRFTALNGLETLSFKKAIDQEPQRMANMKGQFWNDVQPYGNFYRGLYAEHLQEYYKYIPKERILLIKSERLSSEPEKTLREVFRFLGVDEDVSVEEPANFSSPNVRSLYCQRLFRKLFGSRLDRAVQRVRELSANGIMDFIIGLNLTSQKTRMPEDVRTHLIKLYSDSMDALEPMAPWSIDDWRE